MKIGIAGIALFLATAADAAPELVWQEAFAPGASSIHFRARYTEQGDGHRIDVWRTSSQVRRDTDDRIAVVATEEPTDVRIDVLDRRRGLVIHARRGELLRGGMLVDPFELRTGLRKPGGPFALEHSPRPPTTGRDGCSWLTVVSPMDRIDVCWSERWGLPMRIDQGGRPVFVMDAVEERTASHNLFQLSGPTDLDPAGFDD
jgi:hypothetical protein